MKRQRGRNRKPGGGTNNANSSNPNRSWDSQGPENIKVRGNAQTVYERYQQLGRDATAAGDRVLAENYMQHAEHYFRVLRALQPQRSVSEIAARELSNQGYDIDFEDESGAQAAAFLAAQQAADRAQQGESRPERDSGDNETPAGQGQARDSKDRDGPREPRPPRQRDDRPRDDRPRDSQPRDDQPRAEGDDGGPRETRRERWERRRDERNRRFGEGTEGEASASDAGPAAAPESGSGPDAAAPARTEPRARRPRADRSDRPAADTTDETAPALPGFLTRSTVTAAAPAETAEAPVAKRRVPRKKVEAPAADE